MEKFAKYYFWSEGCVLLGVLLSGLYDPSFWLWGVMFVGISLGVIGSVVSIVWYLIRNHLGHNLIAPLAFMICHIVMLVTIFYFLKTIFSDGLHFMM